MRAAHLLSKARNASLTFPKSLPDTILPKLQRNHPADLGGFELRLKVCVRMNGREDLPW